VHDDGTLIEVVSYAFSFFPFFPLPLQLCVTFQRREFQGNEIDGIVSSLLGPVPPLCFSPLPPHFTCKSHNFSPKP
jgi:hypothetical protein